MSSDSSPRELVVVGIGVAPRTELPEAAGLEVDNEVLVDERLEAIRPGVFAAGDLANAKHRFYGRPVRVEHWANALRGDPERREFLAFWLRDRRVLAGMSMNVPDVGERIEALIHERKEIDAERLTDRETPLEEVTTEPVGRRKKPPARPLTAAKNFVPEGVNYTRRLVGDRISRGERASLAAVAAGEG